MKFYRALARASVECEFSLGFTQVKDDSRVSYTEVSLRASVARNFCGIYFRKKGTIK